MSVTFFPANNHKYCTDNNLVTTTNETCQCVECGLDPAGCYSCNGTGIFTSKHYPYEINLSNSNAMVVLRMFGIEATYDGELHPQAFLDGVEFTKSLRAAGVKPLVTNNVVNDGIRGCTSYDFGRTDEQVNHYIESFYALAMEACRRKVDIVWG